MRIDDGMRVKESILQMNKKVNKTKCFQENPLSDHVSQLRNVTPGVWGYLKQIIRKTVWLPVHTVLLTCYIPASKLSMQGK